MVTALVPCRAARGKRKGAIPPAHPNVSLASSKKAVSAAGM